MLPELCAAFSKLPPPAKAMFLARVAHNSTVDARSAYMQDYANPDAVTLRKANEFVHRLTGYMMHVLDHSEMRGQDASVMAMIFELYCAGDSERESQLCEWLEAAGRVDT